MPIQITYSNTTNKVLVLGTGNLGRQALQILANCGFADIEIFDLESGDVRGLQKQFTRKNDFIGKARAELACDAVRATNPNVKIKAAKYGISYFQMFDLVVNALENRFDRDSMNSMCQTADIHIIDCYECANKLTQTYSGCIENPPTDFIHCVVWAKHLFNQLFAKLDENDIQQVARDVNYDCAILFNRLFYDDFIKNVEESGYRAVAIPYQPFTNDMQPVYQITIKRDGNTRWTSDEGQTIFATSLAEIQKKIASSKAIDYFEWIQNDEAVVNFIIASANLRAINFSIPQISYFETQLVLSLEAPKWAELPNECLEGIFNNCDDETLLNASRVCKRFRNVVEGVFERRYSNKPYFIETDGLDEPPSLLFRQTHRAILSHFGSKFWWIFTQINNISWFADILKKNGGNLQILTIAPSVAVHPLLQEPIDLGHIFAHLPNLTKWNMSRAMLQGEWPQYSLPSLKHYHVHATFYDNEEEFYTKFFAHNIQIETISADELNSGHMLRAMSGRLVNLKSLDIEYYDSPENEMRVSLESLETLSLSQHLYRLKIGNALRPFQQGCKNVKRLKIRECTTMEDNDVSAIVSFKKITSLIIEVDDINIAQIRSIESQLPNLTSFNLTIQPNDENIDNRESDINGILSMISASEHLTELHFKIRKDYMEQMNAVFHRRFLNAIGTKRHQFVLKITRYDPILPPTTLTITSDEITMVLEGSEEEYVLSHENEGVWEPRPLNLSTS